MGQRADDMSMKEPEELHAEIARTREDMGDTVDEIQERLSPEHIREQATERVREATVGRMEDARDNAKETGMSMWETVKQNPVPAALVGVGIGWLYMSHSDSGSRSNPSYGYPQPRVQSGSSSDGQGRASQAASEAANQAQEIGGQVRERTENMSNKAQDQMHGVRHQAENLFQENPLMVGALAFGAGALIGLSIPESQREHQLMGEHRDHLAEQVKETAEDKFHRAENVAERAADEARSAADDESRRQGLRE